jgi:type III restriction enzyme
LPYGKRTGVAAVDRLNIVAHDRFQEIVDEANRPESTIRLQTIVLADEDLRERTKTVIVQSNLANLFSIKPALGNSNAEIATGKETPAFQTPEEVQIAQIAYQVIRDLENKPAQLPAVSYLNRPEIQAEMTREVHERYRAAQPALPGIAPDVAAIVSKAAYLVIERTIDIPRIIVVPKGEVRSGFKPFDLELEALRYPAPSEELWIHYLRTGGSEVIGLEKCGVEGTRLEDYVVSGLIDYDDVSYDHHADLLYALASQTVAHFGTYLSEEDTRKVLRLHQREIARFIHAQMQQHYWQKDGGHDVVITKGFSEIKPCAYTVSQELMDFHISPTDKSNMAKYYFGGFDRCLYPAQKFQSEPERILAVILDRESNRWFRPVKGQFQIYYKAGADISEYQPDFIAETGSAIYMLESKAAGHMEDAEVLAKKRCRRQMV